VLGTFFFECMNNVRGDNHGFCVNSQEHCELVRVS
jgi:hypothetical protein